MKACAKSLKRASVSLAVGAGTRATQGLGFAGRACRSSRAVGSRGAAKAERGARRREMKSAWRMFGVWSGFEAGYLGCKSHLEP